MPQRDTPVAGLKSALDRRYVYTYDYIQQDTQREEGENSIVGGGARTSNLHPPQHS